MATALLAAPSPLASSIEKTNGAKLSRLLIDGGTTVLRKDFDRHHPPANLVASLIANKPKLNSLLKKKVLRKPQWDKLFPPAGGAAPDSNTFDITFLFLLLTNICGLSPPSSGWHAEPPLSDTSHEANLARVKFYRNVLYGHVTTTGVDTSTFSALWLEISAVLVALGLDQAEIDRLKAEKGGEQDYIDALLEWAVSEEDIESQLKNIHQSQTKTQQTVEEVHRTQTKTQQTVEKVHQTQTKTQQTMEEVHQTQTKTQQTVEEVHQTQTKTQQTMEEVHQTQTKNQQIMEEVHQTQTKTQQTVEEVHQTQTKTQQTVEEVHQTQTRTEQTMEEVLQTQTKTQQTIKEVAAGFQAGLQEVKEAVGSLKEGRDKDRVDECLQKLAKSEFRGDIEYFVERFQPDTREWVFDKVQYWLDDRSSQNRVMVISGNAGMGKSVIAAVICKRMQEVGRLSGSHFCQYNNARYRKPQLMLQSLACHLSSALPEYKQALVEQLSRNLGIDLNNMGVEELFALLFKEPLSAVVDPGRNMLMVIDGLDESEYQGRNELLDVIANQFCKLPSWIRFLITTRPATNIAEKLKHLKPFELQHNDEKNLEDIRTFFEKKLQQVIKAEKEDDLVEKLVLKSEGLMLYAYFLILFIDENPSILNQEDLDGSLPLGISSVYHSYFKRLESELKKELDIKEEHFLNLLCAITASREPLPIGFVSKVLVPNSYSPLAKRKVLKALECVSALLPIRDDGCLHIIHKSVKDWLTDISCYGEHEFLVGENEGHGILADLCKSELDDLKRRGMHNEQFSSTERYALYHGARHMLHSDVERRPNRLDELTKAYVIDLELVYAKTCVNSTTVAEDLVWLQKQGIFTVLSEECQGILETLLFLMRKCTCLVGFTNHCMFLQTMLNQGGTVLSAEASNLLQNKYREIAYMEYIHKNAQQGDVVAQFLCEGTVICLNVSPELDYMVCECEEGILQLWSLRTGRLMWTRPVKVEKKTVESFGDRSKPYRQLPSSSVFSFFRSVVFHPTKDIILPGILSHAYTIDGELKPLFPKSNCRFSVCSISGDKSKILTDCLDNPKCLVMWSLKNGSEITRINRNENVLSFAWSRDGRLLAISHSDGLICLVDVIDGCRTLAQTATPEVCGMLKFSPDHRLVFCLHLSGQLACPRLFRLNVNRKNHHTFSFDVSSDEVSYGYKECETFSDCGFLFGDPISIFYPVRLPHVFLNEQTLLRVPDNIITSQVEMLNTHEERHETEDIDIVEIVCPRNVALALDGQTVYVESDGDVPSVSAWDVSSGELIAKINTGTALTVCLVPVRGGVLFTSSGTLELWNDDLSECVQRWNNVYGITEVIPISEERAACLDDVRVYVLDTTSGVIVSTIPVLRARVIACNSKCQLLLKDVYGSLLLSGDRTVLWEMQLCHLVRDIVGVFSPDEQFLVIWIRNAYAINHVYILDAVSGNLLHILSGCPRGAFGVGGLTFVSDEECVVRFSRSRLRLFNVKSGDLLSEIDVERDVFYLAACPRNRRLAIHLGDNTPNFKVIQVWLPRDKDRSKSKRINNAPEIAEQGRK